MQAGRLAGRYHELQVECVKLRATLRAAQEALERYGKHDPNCGVEVEKLLTYDAGRVHYQCDCGFQQAREAVRP